MRKFNSTRLLSTATAVILNRLLFALLISFAFSDGVSACSPVVEAWEHADYQGDYYRWGRGCEQRYNWNDKITSIKLDENYVMKFCEHSRYRGVCAFMTGNIRNLNHYRPTGINLNDKISSFSAEYQPASKISISGFYDSSESIIGLLRAWRELRRIETILKSSGLNVEVKMNFVAVSSADTKAIRTAEDALSTARTRLIAQKKALSDYAIYFPEKPSDDKKNNNWDGIAYTATGWHEGKGFYRNFVRYNAFAIVNPNTLPYVVAHEWGHMAGLQHEAGEERPYKLMRPYGVGYYKQRRRESFKTIMSEKKAPRRGRLTRHLIFSAPEMKCNISFFRKHYDCGVTESADARRALIETVLKWY